MITVYVAKIGKRWSFQDYVSLGERIKETDEEAAKRKSPKKAKTKRMPKNK
jgi:hypothetical protein